MQLRNRHTCQRNCVVSVNRDDRPRTGVVRLAEDLRSGRVRKQCVIKTKHVLVNIEVLDRVLTETLAAPRRPRAERSTSAFCSIWLRIGSSMGQRC